MADELGKAIKTEMTDRAKAAVARITCPVHGTGACGIRPTGRGNRVRFEYEACCDSLKEATAATLRQEVFRWRRRMGEATCGVLKTRL